MSQWRRDSFHKKAQRENYLARSVYKLKEIDEREKLFRGGEVVLDLGASPGSWTQYAIERLPKGRVVAIDLSPMRFSHPRVTFFQKGIEEADLSSVLKEGEADIVLSDMAPKTTGIHDTDVARSMELATLALETAKRYLKPEGSFVAKLFMGDSFEEFDQAIKALFRSVRKIRPESTRKHSREIFFVARGYRAGSGSP